MVARLVVRMRGLAVLDGSAVAVRVPVSVVVVVVVPVRGAVDVSVASRVRGAEVTVVRVNLGVVAVVRDELPHGQERVLAVGVAREPGNLDRSQGRQDEDGTHHAHAGSLPQDALPASTTCAGPYAPPT